MLTPEQLDEIERNVRNRRHLSWETIERLIATARAAHQPEMAITHAGGGSVVWRDGKLHVDRAWFDAEQRKLR